MKKIKIAQIGIGHDHANAIFDALNRLTDVFDVVGYAEVEEDNLPYDWSKTNKINCARFYKNSKKSTSVIKLIGRQCEKQSQVLPR